MFKHLVSSGMLWKFEEIDPWSQIFLDCLPYFSEHHCGVTSLLVLLLLQTILDDGLKLLKLWAKILFLPKDTGTLGMAPKGINSDLNELLVKAHSSSHLYRFLKKHRENQYNSLSLTFSREATVLTRNGWKWAAEWGLTTVCLPHPNLLFSLPVVMFLREVELLGEDTNTQLLPLQLLVGIVLWIPWFMDSRVEWIPFWCSKEAGLWCFVTAATGV